jgi:isoquinoline 1-oxidoreductase subunit beta
MPQTRNPVRKSRRRFLIAGTLAGGAFYLGYVFSRRRDRLARPASFATREGESALNGWLKIAADGSITVAVPRQDMGQGIHTALAMLVAEELDADWRKVRAEQAPVDKIYGNWTILADGLPIEPEDRGAMANTMRWFARQLGDKLGVQATGGSTSVRDAWEPMRMAGASARMMLVQAAAQRWNVAASECTTEESFVLHASSGKRLAYGELAADAARLPLARTPRFKDPARYRLIGRSVPRLDIADKVRGGQFGIDVRLPGMLYAAIAQCPVFGGTLKSFDAEKVKSMRGVQQVVALDNAVAVVADGYWNALSALRILPIVWADTPNTKLSTEVIYKQYKASMTNGDAGEYRNVGDAQGALAQAARIIEAVEKKNEGDIAATPERAARVIEADYRAPLLAHATMEPMNCTARVANGECEVWLGNQAPSIMRWIASKTAEVDAERVTVHTPYLGGGFGRRAEIDVLVQAVKIARQTGGKAVQLIWSREEDMQHDAYRPAAIAKFRAALDAQGAPLALVNRIVGPSVSRSFTERLIPWAASDAMQDKTNAEGAADMPYEFAHLRVEHVLSRTPVPVGFWRSVGHSYNAFFKESFIDELAHAAGKDPVAFRAGLLAKHPRHLNVLQSVAEKAGWGTPLAAGTARGVALHESFRSIVAQVAEVSLAGEAIRVKRVVCVIDCGGTVHPDTVIAQMESSIVFGLTAALFGEITLDQGRVQQSNFHDYPMLRMPQTPAIETYIMGTDPAVPPLGGVGEPGVPPIAPAVGNALFALTGKRLRSLPLRMKEAA